MATKRKVPILPVNNILKATIETLLVEPVRADERLWCKYARRDDAAGSGACPEFLGVPDQRPYCGLNGRERATPCAFDEAPDAQIWREIEESVTEYRARGWA